MDKPKLTVIEGTPAPDTIKERVRSSLRKTKQPNIPQCVCGSRTYTYIYTADRKQRVCVFCLMNKKICVM